MNTLATTAAIVADTLVAKLPTTKTLTPVPAPDSALDQWIGHGSAVTATFIGSASVDVAVIIPDVDVLVPAAEGASLALTDLLHNALSDAAAVLGDGVLSNLTVADASELFLDPDTVVFELRDGSTAVGAFALRQRSAVTAGPTEFTPSKLGRISNVEMELTVEIGRTRMSVRDVLGLEPGAVVELDRSAGAPADILLNGRLIAHGEVVVVDQDYAVRVTKILDTQDTVA